MNTKTIREQEMKNEKWEWSSATGAIRSFRDSKRIIVGIIITTASLGVHVCMRVYTQRMRVCRDDDRVWWLLNYAVHFSSVQTREKVNEETSSFYEKNIKIESRNVMK